MGQFMLCALAVVVSTGGDNTVQISGPAPWESDEGFGVNELAQEAAWAAAYGAWLHARDSGEQLPPDLQIRAYVSRSLSLSVAGVLRLVEGHPPMATEVFLVMEVGPEEIEIYAQSVERDL
jgi:hypothetical protein